MEIGDVKKYKDEYAPTILKEDDLDYMKDFNYGGPIIQLRPGIEIKEQIIPSQVFTGHFTITATGSKVITGLGFKPSNLRILSCISGGTGPIKSDGITNGTNMHIIYDYNTNTGMKSYYANDKLIFIEDGSNGTFYNMTAVITSFDTDGFTLNVSNKTLLGTMNCVYIAFK